MRQYIIPLAKIIFSFNPRICKRCDYKNKCNNNQSKVSIHASVKDATAKKSSYKDVTGVSIHASVKDATADLPGLADRNTVSIHASVKDATASSCLVTRTSLFQSTHL